MFKIVIVRRKKKTPNLKIPQTEVPHTLGKLYLMVPQTAANAGFVVQQILRQQPVSSFAVLPSLFCKDSEMRLRALFTWIC